MQAREACLSAPRTWSYGRAQLARLLDDESMGTAARRRFGDLKDEVSITAPRQGLVIRAITLRFAPHAIYRLTLFCSSLRSSLSLQLDVAALTGELGVETQGGGNATGKADKRKATELSLFLSDLRRESEGKRSRMTADGDPGYPPTLPSLLYGVVRLRAMDLVQDESKLRELASTLPNAPSPAVDRAR